jgi:CCR4-NOT transcription complex subunit 1
VKVLFRQWGNLKGQLALIYNSLLLAPEFLNYSQFPSCRKIISNEDLVGYPAAAKSVAASLVTSPWNCYELLEFTGLLIDTEYFEEVKPVFEMASRQCPELLCIGLASLNPPWNSINKEILVKLTCGFLIGQTSSSVVLPKIWSLNSNTMLVCMAEMHRRDATCLSRLLDVAQELKIIGALLEAKPFSFAIDVAALASRRQHLNLEKWIADAVRDKGQPFLQAAVEFAGEKVRFQVKRQRGLQTPPFIPLSNDVLGVFMKVLQGSLAGMSAECLEEFRELQKVLGTDVQQESPGMAAVGAGAAPLASPSAEFPPDVEEEVNAFFDRIFAREVAIGDVVEILQRLRGSSNPRDQQIFACLINNIFDEYRFFPKYPETELLLTATLFGQLINCQLISYVTLGVALRCVLEALKKPPGQKLFKFGLQALSQFQARLAEWPQYCAHILQIPGLQQVHPDLFAYVRNCLTGAPPAQQAPTGSTPAAGTAAVPAAKANPSASDALTSLSIGTLLEAAERAAPVLVPNEQARDRILFIVNNVSLLNLEAKANDLVRILQEPYYDWMAQYLVIRRACIEPNFHQLYLAFLEVLQLHGLEEHILRQTYASIGVLLRSGKTDTSSSERTLLKNLGSWLGGLTLARNRPILHRDMSLKRLLAEAYLTNRLIVVIPFVCKVMEQCARSRVFQPHNPWLMAILAVLVELYHYAELKLNLKFEVEVLCKGIGIELKAIPPSEAIRGAAGSGLGAPRGVPAKPEPFEFLPGPESQAGGMHQPPSGPPPSPSSFESLLALSPAVPALAGSAALRRIVALAVELAIRETVHSVAERAVAIAGNTARTLVLKDFGDDSDAAAAETVRQAARQLAQSLAASLASVTAREPLKPAIAHNIRAFVQLAGLGARLGDTAIQGIAEDNLDLACAYVERSAMDKASAGIIALLDEAAAARGSSGGQHTRAALPLRAALYAELAGSRAGGRPRLPPISLEAITPGELERLTGEVRELALREPGPAAAGEALALDGAEDAAADAGPGLDAFFQATCVRFVELVGAIEALVPAAAAYGSVSKLPPSHELRGLMKQVILLASSSPVHRDELCLLMAQRLMQGLYRAEGSLGVDIAILLLLKIFEFSAKAAKEVTAWVVYSPDERKYSVLATAALFASGLVYVLDFDAQLAKQVDCGREAAADFAVRLIRRCVFEEPAVAAPYDFVYTLEALGKAVQRSASAAAKAAITGLMEAISARVREPQSEPQQLRDQITFAFTDWFRLCQYPSLSDKLMASFVGQLYQRGDFLRAEAPARAFFRTCIEVAVELYMRQRRAPALLAYRSIDALAKLVGQLLKWRPPAGAVSPAEIVAAVHGIAGEILVQGLEQGIDYLQRPFGRLFVCLANELAEVEKSLPEELNHDLLLSTATFYLAASPRLLPQFAFAWLELVSHRGFLPRLLFAPKRSDWPVLARLLAEALAFAAPLFAAAAEAQAAPAEPVAALYRGLLRTLLVIHHDMPEFFVAYHLQFCGLLPLRCHQLRAVVLAASPAGMPLPNPLRPDLKVDLLPEMALPPNVHYDYTRILDEARITPNAHLALRQELDRALAGSVMIGPFCSDLAAFLESPGVRPNLLLWQNLLFYVAMNGLGAVQSGEAPGVSLGRSPSMAILSGLLDALQAPESRYTLLAFLVDQLRFPNRHTHYFSYVILYLFVEPHTGEAVKDQITRILVERLLAHKPHPWGLLVTFVELVKNAHYRFWEYRFTRASPEVEHILRSIAQSCLSADSKTSGAASGPASSPPVTSP